MPTLPATATDALVLASIALRTKIAGCTVVAAPGCPDYWFANCLVLDREPEPALYPSWIARHAGEVAGRRAQRRVVVWETAGQRLREPPAAAKSFEYGCSTVFAVRGPPRRQGSFAHIREFDRPSDWPAAAALERQQVSADGQPSQADFVTWRFQLYRADAERGRCRFWGAFADRELLAFAGLYADDLWARFVTPITQPAFRRRGLFGALCNVGVGETLSSRPGTRVVIVAARDDAAERIYLRLGFEPVGRQHALIAPVTDASGATAP